MVEKSSTNERNEKYVPSFSLENSEDEITWDF